MQVVHGDEQRGIKDPSPAQINEKRPSEIFSITFVGHSSQSSVSPAFNGVQGLKSTNSIRLFSKPHMCKGSIQIEFCYIAQCAQSHVIDTRAKSNSRSREFGSFLDGTGTGTGKIWSRKKVQEPVPQKFGPGKRYRRKLGPIPENLVPEKFGPRKSTGTGKILVRGFGAKSKHCAKSLF